MTTVKRTVFLISEQQRNALLSYLQDRPYREVATGIQFLLNAPTATLNVDAPEEQIEGLALPEGEVEPEAQEEAAREPALV
jgi:hypothetical protein